ncbi:hypothetical protein LJK87_20220 [Paenibacillus sp. P25]|nr:hypothetical protein LJK87_20220 [Paenibacillus sp. P25]
MTTGARRLGIGLLSLLLSGLIFWVPFYFVIINSFKNTTESSQFNMARRRPSKSSPITNPC